MLATAAPVVIVDYGIGNLFSVRQACAAVGLEAVTTSSGKRLLEAPALILPGVGAFGDAMRILHEMDLIAPIREFASSGRIVFGICLGLQLLLSESHEFGRHRGLDLIPGDVVPLPRDTMHAGRRLKVPNVGWSTVWEARPWAGTLLDGLPTGTSMYFVHSYRVQPADTAAVIARSRRGDVDYPSALAAGNLFGTQFHPERSGPAGLSIYRNLAQRVSEAVRA